MLYNQSVLLPDLQRAYRSQRSFFRIFSCSSLCCYTNARYMYRASPDENQDGISFPSFRIGSSISIAACGLGCDVTAISRPLTCRRNSSADNDHTYHGKLFPPIVQFRGKLPGFFLSTPTLLADQMYLLMVITYSPHIETSSILKSLSHLTIVLHITQNFFIV